MVSSAQNGSCSATEMTIRNNFRSIVILCLVQIISTVAYSSGETQLTANEVCTKCHCMEGVGGYFGNQLEVSIDCSQRQLNDLPVDWPSNITQSEDLKDAALVVSFSGNPLITLRKLPPTLAKNVSFSFRYCGLTELVSGAFMDVPFLEKLDLSCNSLTTESLHGDVFRGRYNVRNYEPLPVRILLLAQNRLTNGLSALSLEHMPDLRKLDLSYNYINELHEGTLRAITGIRKLEVLDLSHTGISFLSQRLVKSLTSIRELNLRGNKFVFVPESLAITGKTLIKLDFSNNPLQSIDEKSFLGLTTLQQLNLNHMPNLNSIGENAFSSILNLKVLQMSRCPNLKHINKLAFADPKLLNGPWTLEELHLAGNNLSTLPILMREWTPLRVLNLNDNPWNCKCSLAFTLDYHQNALKHTSARCKTPYERAGTLLTNVAEEFCLGIRSTSDDDTIGLTTVPKPGKSTPRHYRPHVITALVIFVLILTILGATLGYLGSCLKERLRRRSSQPIKYTHIRNSIITNVQTN